MEHTNSWRTISLFISSTFIDMEPERDYLKKFVFKELEDILIKKRITLNIIDLRWGVNTNDCLDSIENREAKILKVCFNEIDRSRPFFIALLGDRYGWIPPYDKCLNAINKLSNQNNSFLNKSVTALEIMYGALESNEQLSRSLFYFRSADYSQMTNEDRVKYQETDPELVEKTEELKQTIIECCKNSGYESNIRNYSVSKWDAKLHRFLDLEAFGNEIREHLLQEIIEEVKDTESSLPHNWYEEEEYYIDAFLQRNIENFVGHVELISQLEILLEKKEKCILTGSSGAGKSTVMCQILQRLKSNKDKNRILLFHSAGLSPISQCVKKMLQRFSWQLSRQLNVAYEEINLRKENESYRLLDDSKNEDTVAKQIIDQFREFVRIAKQRNLEVVLLIDALDRFNPSNIVDFLTFLPNDIPVIISTLPEKVPAVLSFHKAFIIKNINFFSKDDARNMILKLCDFNHKDLYESVLERLLDKQNDGYYAYSSPLWVTLAANILFSLDSDDFQIIRSRKEEDNELKILNYLLEVVDAFPVDAGELFLLMISRAAEDFDKKLTFQIFSYIVLTRGGLREKDLAELLGDDWDELLFAALRRWFRSFIVENDCYGQWYFSHYALMNFVLAVMPKEDQEIIHWTIAIYLIALPHNDILRQKETMYHLIKGNRTLLAASYYASATDSSLQYATQIIYDEINNGTITVDWLCSLLEGDESINYSLIENYIFDLNNKFEEEGHVMFRIELMEKLKGYAENFNIKNQSEENTLLLSLVYWRLGLLNVTIGNVEKAERYFEIEERLLLDLYEQNKENIRIKHELGILYSNLSTLNLQINKLELARSYVEKQYFFFKASANLDETIEVALTYGQLGSLSKMLGHLEKAEGYFQEELNALSFCKTNIADVKLKSHLANSYGKLGELNLEKGNVEIAIEYLEKRKLYYLDLFNAYPSNYKIKRGLAVSYSKLGDCYSRVGNLQLAEEYASIYSQYLIEISEIVPEDVDVQLSVVKSFHRLGALYLKNQNLENAKIYIEKYHTRCVEIYKNNPDADYLKEELALSYYDMGELFKSLSQNETSLENYKKHLINCIGCYEKFYKLSEQLYKVNHIAESLKNKLALACTRLGDFNKETAHFWEAKEFYCKSVIFAIELYEANPTKILLKKKLSIAYSDYAQICQHLLDTEIALFFYEQDLVVALELYNEFCENESFKDNLDISLSNLRQIYKKIGDIEKADIVYQERERLRTLNFNLKLSKGFLDGLLISSCDFGDIYMNLGESDLAEKYYNRELDLDINEVVLKDKLLCNKIIAYNLKLAELYYFSKKCTQEELCIQSAEKLILDLLIIYPENLELQEKLSDVYQRHAYYAIRTMYTEKAVAYFEKNIELLSRLAECNPLNNQYKYKLATSFIDLAFRYKEMGKIREAGTFLIKASDMYEDLISDSEDGEFRKKIILSYEKLEDFYGSTEDKDREIFFLRKHEALLMEYLLISQDESLKICLKDCLMRLGALHKYIGDKNKSKDYYKRYGVLATELYGHNPLKHSFKSMCIDLIICIEECIDYIKEKFNVMRCLHTKSFKK